MGQQITVSVADEFTEVDGRVYGRSLYDGAAVEGSSLQVDEKDRKIVEK